MKKILSIALVALLAASTVFAGFSGKATLSLGYDTESKSFGFSNGKSFSLDLDLATETAEKVAEGDIYAGVKATFALKVAGSNNKNIFSDNSSYGEGLLFSLKEAYIAGQDWKVSITGTQSGPDFAKSAIDTVYDKLATDAFGYEKTAYYWNKKYKAKSYAVSTYKAPGFTVTYKDWSIAAGFEGGKADSETGAPDYFNYHASVFTPALEVADGLTVKAAAVASSVKNALDTTKDYGTYKISTDGKYADKKNYDAFGASAEVAYASDSFSGKFDVDFGMKKTVGKDNFALGLDVAANAVISGFTVDAYYQYDEKDQWISAQVKGDLNEFDVPVVITVYGNDVMKGQKFGGEVSATFDAFTVTAGGSYELSSKKLAVSGSVKYAAEKFTATAGANFSKTLEEDGAKKLYANASIESDVIIPGATLALEYGPNVDNYSGDALTNYLAKEATFGYVSATCTIAF